VLSGDDEMTVAICALGGDGLISVASNAAPRLMSELVHAALAGDAVRARALHQRALPLMRAASVESNPIPIKAALSMLGRFAPVYRSPLVPLDSKHDGVVRAALQHAGAL
jgi:4-hydroxy-tetrahydrodipicolinate synthase